MMHDTGNRAHAFQMFNDINAEKTFRYTKELM